MNHPEHQLLQKAKDKRARQAELRQRLAKLTDADKQALANRGMIATVEGRTLSLHNTLLLYLQSPRVQPTVVGGYRQWQRAGKQVKRGEHGSTIWFPAGEKTEDGDIISADTFYTATVFDISQVEERV